MCARVNQRAIHGHDKFIKSRSKGCQLIRGIECTSHGGDVCQCGSNVAGQMWLTHAMHLPKINNNNKKPLDLVYNGMQTCAITF